MYMFIVQISPQDQQTTIYTPGIGTHYFYSLISSGENSAFAHFAAAIANHYNSAFSFHQVPITAGWTEASWYERLAQHLCTWPTAWLDRAAVTHPSTNRARRCLTSVIWRELVTVQPCATTLSDIEYHRMLNFRKSFIMRVLRGSLDLLK